MESSSQSLKSTPNSDLNSQDPVPFLNLKDLVSPFRQEIDRAMKSVIDRGQFIGGEELKAFENNFANFIGPGNFVVGCGNGTDAITLAARSLNLPEGSEVLVPAMTFYSTVSGLIAAGLKVRLADVKSDTWLLDSEDAKSRLTDKTKLIAPVHLYGQMVAMDEFRSLADEKGLFILEDSAQAHGATWKGKAAGHWGDIVSYSFFPGKNLGAFGDGGCVLSQDAQKIETCRALGNTGALKKYEHNLTGYNSRLDNLQAAILDIKLKHLAGWNIVRQKVAAHYLDGLADIPGLTLPTIRKEAESVFHLFVILVEDRVGLQEYLKKQGVMTGFHYPQAIHQLKAFEDQDFAKENFPNAEKVAKHCLSLPMCPTLKSSQVDRVVKTVRSYFGK